MRTINALSHRPSSCASNCMAFTPPLTSSCWTAYALGIALRSSQSPASLTRSVPSLAGWAASTGAKEADALMAIISVQVGRARPARDFGRSCFRYSFVRHSQALAWLSVLYEEEMAAAAAPDPQHRAPILSVLRQCRRLPSVPNVLTIDGLNNVPRPETCLRGR